MKNLVCVVCLVSLAVLASVQSASADLYQFTDLGTLGGTVSVARGINSSGQVVGYSYGASGGLAHAFIYSNGVMSNLNGLETGFSDAYDINDSGVVVGRYAPTGYRPFMYSNGVLRDMGSLGGSGPEVNASGINASGQVSGTSLLAASSGGYPHAFFYSNNLMYDASPNVDFASGNGINDSGKVVGTTYTHNVFIYYNGLMGYTNISGDATGINNNDHVVGKTGGSSFLWQNGTVQIIGPGTAFGINNLDQVVGTTSTTTGYAYVYSNGQFQNLNNLVFGMPANWVMRDANAINDSGQIVGRAVDNLGEARAFLLTPIPSPASLVLFGVSSLFISRRRR